MSIKQGSAGAIAGAAAQTLFTLRGANLAIDTDQPFVKQFAGSAYVVTNIIAVRKTGAFGVACLGGIYTGAAKSGSTLLAAAQTWAALTGAATAQVATLANILQTVTATATPILSLTTANTGALTADLFIVGCIVD